MTQVIEKAMSGFPLNDLLTGNLSLCITGGKETTIVACKTIIVFVKILSTVCLLELIQSST